LQITFIAKILLSIPNFPISPELSVSQIATWITVVIQSILDFFSVQSSVVIENEALKKEITLLKEKMEIEQDYLRSQRQENDVLRGKIFLEQEKNNLLNLSQKDLTNQLQKERTITQFDSLTQWLSISSSAVMFLSSITGLSCSLYNIFNGGSNSGIKSSIKELLSHLNMLNRTIINDRAVNRRTNNAPGVSPNSINFEDVDNS
jgi:hypothetical protein